MRKKREVNSFIASTLNGGFTIASQYFMRSGPFNSMFDGQGKALGDISKFYQKFLLIEPEFYWFAETISKTPAFAPKLTFSEIFQNCKWGQVEGDDVDKKTLFRALNIIKQTSTFKQ